MAIKVGFSNEIVLKGMVVLREKMIILNAITSHFLNFGDFNGLPFEISTDGAKAEECNEKIIDYLLQNGYIAG